MTFVLNILSLSPSLPLTQFGEEKNCHILAVLLWGPCGDILKPLITASENLSLPTTTLVSLEADFPALVEL